MNRVVISGATGAIGMALIHKCIQESTEALVIIREDSRRRNRIPVHSLISVLECSLEDMKNIPDEQILKLGRKYDVFYHFAWSGPYGDSRNDMRLQNKNVEYTLDAVELAERLGCHTFIGAGSQAEYGRVDGYLNSQVPTNPENGYGIAKLCAGQMSRLRCHQLGMKHIWTRILSVYGPYDADYTMVMSTIYQLLDGKVPKFTKAEQRWDYIYSSDVARAMYLLGEKGIDGKIYCIGSGSVRVLSEYIFMIRDAVDHTLPLEIGALPYAPFQVMKLCADIEELRKDTGFLPQVSFEEGIKDTVDWVRLGN